MSRDSGESNGLDLQSIINILFVLAMMLSLPVQALCEALFWLKNGFWLNWSALDAFPQIFSLIDQIKWVGLRHLLHLIGEYWVTLPVAVIGGLFTFRMEGFG
ncbi:hypothetical protein [Cypionkella sp.]|uniref:hypothetical protein n=1 Tax=Cypionkella sp. TaxID=2811411 RepID=UPI002716FFB6|nr:hypothetical protein [Cypionkella sp.]MDO8983649.1 hypothetical protein [Cypionkella sp.]MDP1575841.1 hypothetical protein [Cypionkella sp.]MDP2050116.1 hypothetical protein [Cypionkella sp.]